MTQQQASESADHRPSRFVVGIDLGTTNSALAYIDTEESPWQIRVLAIPQIVAASHVEARETLPSFHYQATAPEAAASQLRLPWSEDDPQCAVGVFAREEGSRAPGRLIASAKSWLCHSGVDRTAELLPWQGDADVEQLSPVEVTARYLRHLHQAWDAAHPNQPLAEQHVVVTLPASFDEVARELTIRAAADAGLLRVVLIEEPQAAFYAWLYRHQDDWQDQVTSGQTILVCDIGGGTSDFTLIRARARDDDGKVAFQRVAVGNHLILGGDNLDLALAHHVERKFSDGERLPPREWDVLLRSCRRAKETLLGDDGPESLTMNVAGSGSKVIGGGRQVQLERTEVTSLLIDGFLPHVPLDAKLRQRQSGFQELGLPYAADHGITRYLAAFLSAHRQTVAGDGRPTKDPAQPDVVLFNGGFFASSELRNRLLEVLSSWFASPTGSWRPRVLETDRLDLAVAEGAAYYGMVQRGEGIAIAANLARSYYIGVEGDEPLALCVIPGNAEPGREFALEGSKFQLTISRPVEFPLFVSSTRLMDAIGALTPIDLEQLTPLPPIRTVLRADRGSAAATVPVTLHARLTEIGTIELWFAAVESKRTWRLQFDVRSATQTDIAAHESAAETEGFIDEETTRRCGDLIRSVFAPGGSDDPQRLMKRLAQQLDSDRSRWPTSLLRRMWEVLMEVEAGRRRSAAHESRWINLVGFTIRPGYGFAMDDWRVAETWRSVRGKIQYETGDQSQILWRRLAGGLSRGQQVAIGEPALAAIAALQRRFSPGGRKGKDASLNAATSNEIWRLVGSLELLPVPTKIELGNIIVELFPKRKLQAVRDAMVWALGRLGQRVPMYGPLNTIVPIDTAADWLDALRAQSDGAAIDQLAAMQIARRTDDRHRDLARQEREKVAAWIDKHGGRDTLVHLVLSGGQLETDERNQIAGESLPPGLRIL